MRKSAKLPLDELLPYTLTIPKLSGGDEPTSVLAQFNWPAIFHNAHPVEIEVGFGKGGWLVAAADERRDTNFVGIEVIRALQLYAATRLAKRNLTNARVACADARVFFRQLVPKDSLQAVHVYFPDPWWKARHKKRRVFTAEFAEAVQHSLKPGGRLLLATDVEEYFDVMTALAAQQSLLREIDRTVVAGTGEGYGASTNFERKAFAAGSSICRAEYQRRP